MRNFRTLNLLKNKIEFIMRVIDNRYKILSLFYTEPLYDEYIVRDGETSKEMSLFIFKHRVFEDVFASFIRRDFLRLSKLDNFFLEKSYVFQNIRSIDNELSNGVQFFVCEKAKTEFDIFTYLQSCSFMQKIELFVAVCRAVFFLHRNGLAYSGVPLESLLLFSHNGEINVRLKNLVMRKFNLCYKAGDEFTIASDKGTDVFLREKQKDTYSLGLILCSFLQGYEVRMLTEQDVKKLSIKNYNNKTRIKQLKNLLLKIISRDADKSLDANNIIYELSQIFAQQYRVFFENELKHERLLPSYVSNVVDMQLIVSSSFKREPFVKAENIFLVTGKAGCGKTRFLQEVQTRLQFEKILVLDYYDIEKIKFDDLCSCFFNNTSMIGAAREKPPQDTVPRQNAELLQDYFNFFENAKKSLQKLNKNFVIAIIVDDIDHIKNKNFLRCLCGLAYELRNLNIVFIFSYDDSDTNFDNDMVSYLSEIQKNNFYKKIHLTNLSPALTKKIIYSLLQFDNEPVKFTENLFLQSNGNPGALIDFIEKLFKSKKLHRNTKTGYCELDESYQYKIKNVKLNAHILTKNLQQWIAGLSKMDVQLIDLIAIFRTPVDESWLLNHKSDAEKNYIKNALERFTASNIISVKKTNTATTYFISDYILKDLIFDNLSSSRKVALHKEAARQIICDNSFDNLNERAFHLRNSHELSAARKCYIKLAIKHKKEKSFVDVIENLLHVWECTDKSETLFLTKLFLDLGTFYFECGLLNNSKEFLDEAMKYAKQINNTGLLLEIYIQYLFLSDLRFDTEALKLYEEKSEQIISRNPEKYARSSAGLLRMQGLNYYDAAELSKAKELCKKIIDIAKDRPGIRKEKSNTLRLYADIFSRERNFKKSKELLEESTQLAEKCGHARGVLYGYIAFAFLYNLQGNRAKAMEYYRKTQVGSIKYKMVNSELLANDYIANEYFNSNQYQLAYRYAQYGFELATKNRISESMFRLSLLLIHICLRLNYIDEAQQYFNTVTELSEKKKVTAYNYDYNIVASQYHAYFHEYDKANEYFKKIYPYNVLRCDLIIDDIDFYVELLAFDLQVGDEKAKVGKILNLVSKHSGKDKVLIEHAYIAFLHFVTKNSTRGMKAILELLINIKENEISMLDRNKIYFIKSLVEKSNKKNYLYEIVKRSFKMNLGTLKIYALIELAHLFVKEKNYNTALAFYLEASFAIKYYLELLPADKRYPFFIGENFYAVAENIELLLKNETEILIAKQSTVSITKKDFTRFMKKDFLKACSKKRNFYYEIIPTFLNCNPPLLPNENILDKLNAGIQNDIHTFLKTIVCELLATDAFIVLVKNKNEVEVIAHYSYMNTEPNFNLFYKITSSEKPVILNRKQLANIQTKTNIKTCMTFPIMQSSSITDASYTAFTYLYIDSLYAMNLIEQKALILLGKYKNLLGMLLTSYSLYQVATVDKLTKALTREALHARLEAYANQYSVFSVLYYDLDSFKRINDTYDHDVGDMVLAQISELISGQLTEPEFLGRQGGEEFIVCLPNKDSKAAFEFAEKIRKAVEGKSFLGYDFSITISIGLASYGEHSRIVSDILHKADHAMYYSKQTGKNKTTIWNENLQTNILSLDGLSRIANMNDFWNIDTTNFIVDILKLANAKISDEKIIDNYILQTKKFLNAEYGFIIYARNKKIINRDVLETLFNAKEPFWFHNIVDFIDNEYSEVKILSDFPENEYNAIFQNGVSILLVPLIFQEKFLGLNCFVTHHYIKDFTVADASVQVFATNLIAHSCYNIYQAFDM